MQRRGLSQLASAMKELATNPGRSMGTIQAAVVGYFDVHQITRFIIYAMSTGNWSTQPIHSTGNMVATMLLSRKVINVRSGMSSQCVTFFSTVR